MFQEFKNFASRENFILRSNTLELAIGLTLIFALEKLISSLVLDIVLPAISLMGALDFSNRFIALSPSVSAANLTDAAHLDSSVPARFLVSFRCGGPALAGLGPEVGDGFWSLRETL